MGIKKRILYILPATAFGGAEQMALDVLSAIDYDRTDMWVASMKDILSGHISRLGLPVTYVPSLPWLGPLNDLDRWLGRRDGSWWGVFSAWSRFFGRVRPDKIILGNAFYSFSLAEVVAAWRASQGNLYLIENSVPLAAPVKSSGRHFGFLPGFGLWWHREVLPLRLRGCIARGILAASDGVRRRIVDWGYPESRVWVTRHGIDAGRFGPAPQSDSQKLRAAFGIPEQGQIILSTARFSKEKRVDRLVKAFDQLARRRSDVWLLLLGDGPLKNQILDLIRSSSSCGRIRLVGHVEDVLPALRISNVYALTSDTEALGLALLEAMASQLICVATRTTGPREIIESGRNGILVDISTKGVLEGLETALKLNDKERGTMGIQARETVSREFRVEDAVRRKLEVLGLEPCRRAAAAKIPHVTVNSNPAEPAGARLQPNDASD